MRTLQEQLENVETIDEQIDVEDSQWKRLTGIYAYSNKRFRVVLKQDVSHPSQSSAVITVWDGDKWQTVATLLETELSYQERNMKHGLGGDFYRNAQIKGLKADVKKLLALALQVVFI